MRSAEEVGNDIAHSYMSPKLNELIAEGIRSAVTEFAEELKREIDNSAWLHTSSPIIAKQILEFSLARFTQAQQEEE